MTKSPRVEPFSCVLSLDKCLDTDDDADDYDDGGVLSPLPDLNV